MSYGNIIVIREIHI